MYSIPSRACSLYLYNVLMFITSLYVYFVTKPSAPAFCIQNLFVVHKYTHSLTCCGYNIHYVSSYSISWASLSELARRLNHCRQKKKKKKIKPNPNTCLCMQILKCVWYEYAYTHTYIHTHILIINDNKTNNKEKNKIVV